MTPATRLSVVRDVMIAGRWVVRGRALLTLDVAEVVADAERYRAAIGDWASPPGSR